VSNQSMLTYVFAQEKDHFLLATVVHFLVANAVQRSLAMEGQRTTLQDRTSKFFVDISGNCSLVFRQPFRCRFGERLPNLVRHDEVA
jgi:hypothetical protein